MESICNCRKINELDWIHIRKCTSSAKSTGKYTSSIWSQAKELKSSVEYQLGANHLLSEGKALMYAGAF